MRILTLCYEFPPLGGGGAKVVAGLGKALVRRGHTLDLITMGYQGLPKHELIDGINVHRISGLRTRQSMCYTPEMLPYIFAAIPMIARLMKQHHYDLNHTHFIFPDGILAYLIHKFTALPYIITAHGSDVPGYNPDRFHYQHRIFAPLWTRVVQKAERIVCPSQSIESLVHKAAPRPRTVIIPNGMNVDKFNPGHMKVNRILIVTRMFERKGVQYLLKALENLDSDYEVHAVGDGPYLETLKGQVNEKNLDVKFWGFLDNQSQEIRVLYETSRIFVFPSEAENFPIVLLEAMAAGMAIITTEGTGCAEVVGDAALFAKPRDSQSLKDALTRLIADPDLCAKLGSRARQRLEEHFGWGTVSRQYSDLYEQIAGIRQ
ncbi:MAG: glycosyltransferase family 4 protein [Nitrospirales bacterium]|nr:glycosyltransferase family 4 protein [Nitrospira sp.]MDR4502170.1 glycosyltransferase family 4 protein [Nitrospirales bacterium]